MGDFKINDLLQQLEIREAQENAVFACQAEEILEKLNVKLENLPNKSRDILRQLRQLQEVTGIKKIDKVNFLVWHSQQAMDNIDRESHLLSLKHKSEELDFQIDELNKEITKMAKELEDSKNNLCKHPINPENITSEINLISKKLLSYEQNYEKTKQNFAKLNVPLDIYPKSLQNLIAQLTSLRSEESELKDKAENIILARSAKENLLKLKGNKF